MATINFTRNKTLPDSSAKSDFHDLIDTLTATISDIVNADISSSANIADSKLATITTAGKVSGTAINYLNSLPSGAGQIAYQHIVQSLASGAVPAFDGVSNFVGLFQFPYNMIVSSLASGAIPMFNGGNLFVGANYPTSSKIKIGRFSRDLTTASGTQSITGLGFQPDVVIFGGVVDGTTAMSVGVSDGTNGYVFYDQSRGGTGANDWGLVESSAGECIYMYPTSSNYQTGKCSMTSDGFDISWTKAGSPTGTAYVWYVAIKS